MKQNLNNLTQKENKNPHSFVHWGGGGMVKTAHKDHLPPIHYFLMKIPLHLSSITYPTDEGRKKQ